MVPNFRLPLLTNGSFPENETRTPIKNTNKAVALLVIGIIAYFWQKSSYY
jgi:hypothetical protein